MKGLLKSAISKLDIVSVALRSSEIKVADSYNCLNINNIKKNHQSMKFIAKIEFIEMKKNENDAPDKYFFSFHYVVGSRLVKNSDEDEQLDDEAKVILTVETIFEAIYSSDDLVPEKELEAFAANNVGYHVWPYWREFLQSSCARMNIAPIPVAFYNADESDLTERE